ncbi:protein huluwa-like [Microcaecilia unicolor]|uniref:Protein huluwa-like n=1 Tax=Microcaecilia unicolor TaxID=1415580 RepID=A0A6P7WWW7_9AMPH|nr:protein huluwa-like [Microcaecilia unicolor]
MVTLQPSLVRSEAWSPASTQAPPVGGPLLALQPLLTLLVALLIPSLVLLFLLNCLLLLYRLPDLTRRSQMRRSGQRDEQQSYTTDPGVTMEVGGMRRSSKAFQELLLTPGSAACPGIDVALSLGERPSSRARPCSKGLRKPDGSAGVLDVAYLQPPSTVTSSMTSRKQPPPRRTLKRSAGCNQTAGLLATTSSSDLEARPRQVPPNSPEIPAGGETPRVIYTRKTSTQRKADSDTVLVISPPDPVQFEYPSSIPHEEVVMPRSAYSSFAGPGLDSDFGASAGISLRILSSDSDSCSHSWISGLEWDYYDPGYKRRAQRRKQRHQLPILCSKQYWV